MPEDIVDRIERACEEDGCSCPCDHGSEDHDEECLRCFACLAWEAAVEVQQLRKDLSTVPRP